jgi:hypothetical protein
MGYKGLFMRSRDLVVAFRNLFVSFRDFFINLRDLLVIFTPTNGININNRLILPEEDNFCPFTYSHTWHCTHGTLLFTLSHLRLFH